MWLFPLCWQQQSRWRILLLRAWCFHGKWDGRWRTQKNGRRRRWCLPQKLCPLGAHSSNGGIWGHSQGGMPFFSVVTRAHFWKAVVMWEGSIRAKEPLIFLFVCLEAEMSLHAKRPTSSDAKLMGGRISLSVSQQTGGRRLVLLHGCLCLFLLSACASMHAPCLIAFKIICSATLCLVNIVLFITGWLQPDSMW